ncbi:hypothetical protein DMENIID0001_114790 [Sergentomyia squamirostris]
MDWIPIKIENAGSHDQDESVDDDNIEALDDAQDSNSGDDPLATGTVSSINGGSRRRQTSTPAQQRSSQLEKRKSIMKTSELLTNIKNRKKVVKRIAAGLRTELNMVERRRRDIHHEFIQLKTLNEYYKKLERSVIQIKTHKKAEK